MSVKVLSFSVFNGCVNLETVTLSEGVERIEAYAFAGCKKLDGITLPEKLLFVGSNAFGGCEALESIYIPASVETVEDYAFYGSNENLVLNLQAESKKDGFEDKFNYVSETKALTTNYNVDL